MYSRMMLLYYELSPMITMVLVVDEELKQEVKNFVDDFLTMIEEVVE
jgi:hypothetical protein